MKNGCTASNKESDESEHGNVTRVKSSLVPRPYISVGGMGM